MGWRWPCIFHAPNQLPSPERLFESHSPIAAPAIIPNGTSTSGMVPTDGACSSQCVCILLLKPPPGTLAPLLVLFELYKQIGSMDARNSRGSAVRDASGLAVDVNFHAWPQNLAQADVAA